MQEKHVQQTLHLELIGSPTKGMKGLLFPNRILASKGTSTVVPSIASV